MSCHQRKFYSLAMRLVHTSAVSLAAWATFVEVCDSGSLSRAAQTLGYSQSAVSRQVTALERELGAPLLDRLPRGILPTPQGDAFLRHARVVVNEAARARTAVHASLAGHPPPLAVGAFPSAMVGLIPLAISAAQKATPHQRFTLTAGSTPDLETAVLQRKLEVAVVTDFPPGLTRNTQLTRTRLAEEEMVAILPADHHQASRPRRRRLDLARLAEDVWVEDHPGSAAVLAHAAAKAGFTPRVELDAGDLMGKVALVATGHAVALIPSLLLPGLRADVVVRRLKDPPLRRVYAVTTTKRPITAATEFVRALRQVAAG